jgi:cytochrome c biogenesis protein CcdA
MKRFVLFLGGFVAMATLCCVPIASQYLFHKYPEIFSVTNRVGQTQWSVSLIASTIFSFVFCISVAGTCFTYANKENNEDEKN